MDGGMNGQTDRPNDGLNEHGWMDVHYECMDLWMGR